MTQQTLAEHAGVEYKYFQKIEGGEPLNLTLATMERLAKALKADVSDLLRRP